MKSFWLVPVKPVSEKQERPRKLSVAQEQLVSMAARGCAACPLDKERLNSPKMKPTGPKHARLYILGEAPGETEDDRGEQFVGKAGKVVRRRIPEEWEGKIRWNNVIRCRPPRNREPHPLEIACCRSKQENDIEQCQPELVIGFGNVPLQWAIGQDKISAWRGRLIPMRIGTHSFWFMPMLHPSYVMRKEFTEDGASIEEIFTRDLNRAFDLLNKMQLPPPKLEDASKKDLGVRLLMKDPEEVLDAIRECRSKPEWKRFALDLETRGLRPFHANSHILSVAVSNYETTLAWPIRHRQTPWPEKWRKRIEEEMCDWICQSSVIAHNSRFEQEWLAFFYGKRMLFDPRWHDTMAQAYTLDEREGKALDQVTLINLGVNIKSWSRVNRKALHLEGLERELRYNAYDAKYTFRAFEVQLERLRHERLVPVYRMNNERAVSIVAAQLAGVDRDEAAVKRFDETYRKKIAKIELDIQTLPAVRKYVAQRGVFKPNSPRDLLLILRDQLGFRRELQKGRAKDKWTTDEEALEKINHPLAKLVLQLRGLKKLHSTYIIPYLPGGAHVMPDGKVHTNYNHLRTSTGRTASDDPNLQNFPIRKNKEVRSIIRAPDKHHFVAFDYGQIEARVIAMGSRDNFLVNALWEGYDIHSEWARKIVDRYPQIIGGKKFLKDPDVFHEIRHKAKNQWVFPLFFGSVEESCENDLGVPKGTLRREYDEFWYTFGGVKEWQETLRKFYRKHGYVQALTGRRRHGPMSFNEMVNSPVQGTASDIVVDAQMRLSRLSYEKGLEWLQWRLNVHDDLSFYLPEKNVSDKMERIAREMVHVEFPFVNVPIVVEIKFGRSWADVEEIEKVSSVDYGHKRRR